MWNVYDWRSGAIKRRKTMTGHYLFIYYGQEIKYSENEIVCQRLSFSSLLLYLLAKYYHLRAIKCYAICERSNDRRKSFSASSYSQLWPPSIRDHRQSTFDHIILCGRGMTIGCPKMHIWWWCDGTTSKFVIFNFWVNIIRRKNGFLSWIQFN